MPLPSRQSGATLFEIAIVIAVAGIFLGSVLAATSVFSGAKVRNAISQFEQYDARSYAFRSQYDYLPGDLTLRAAQRSGFIARTGFAGHGDGNQLIEGCDPKLPAHLGCENILYWRDLSQVQYVKPPLTAATDNPVDGTTPEFLVAHYLPESPFHPVTQVHVYPYHYKNHYYVSTVFATSATGQMTTSGGVDVAQVMAIEDKIDDSVPYKGMVLAMKSPGVLDTGEQSVYSCVKIPQETGVLIYNLDAKPKACQISIRSTM